MLEDASVLLANVALASEVRDPKVGDESEEGDDDGEIADEEVRRFVVVLVQARMVCEETRLTTFEAESTTTPREAVRIREGMQGGLCALATETRACAAGLSERSRRAKVSASWVEVRL